MIILTFFCPIYLCQHAISLKPNFSTLSCPAPPLVVLFIGNDCSTFLYLCHCLSVPACVIASVCVSLLKTSQTLLTTGSVARASLSVESWTSGEKKVAFLSFKESTYCFLDTQDLLNSLAELVDVRLLVKLAGRQIFSEVKVLLEITTSGYSRWDQWWGCQW